jgi:hypothetical protein
MVRHSIAGQNIAGHSIAGHSISSPEANGVSWG